jgi:hypothetical protein
VIEPFAAVKLPVLMVPVLKLPVLKLAVVKFVMLPLVAVKFAVLIVPDVKLVIEPLVAVKRVVLIVPDVRFVIEPLVAVKFAVLIVPAVRFVIEPVVEVNPVELNAVKDPTVRLLTLKLLMDAVPITGQLSVEFPGRPSPHCNTLTVPFANAFCIGSVITNPELTNNVAKIPLILVCVVLGVVLIFVMSNPSKCHNRYK